MPGLLMKQKLLQVSAINGVYLQGRTIIIAIPSSEPSSPVLSI